MAGTFEGNSKEQIATIAKQVGGRVDRVSVDDTSAGKRVVATVTVPSSWASFLMLQMLAIEDVGDPLVRDFALDLRVKVGADPETFATALQQWVQENVSYVRETHEMFQDAAYTLHVRAGDCDDHARLIYACCESAGFNARIAPLLKGEKDVAHAVSQVQVGGEWRWCETTIKAHFGEHPVAAARRLGLNVRKDVVGDDTVVGA